MFVHLLRRMALSLDAASDIQLDELKGFFERNG